MQLTVQQWISSSDSEIKNAHPPFFPQGNDIIIGSCEFSEKENMFKIHMGANYNGTYDISADRIIGGRGLLDFIFQVHMKHWVTAQHIKDFLDVLLCWTYRDHGQLPQSFYRVIAGMSQGMDEPNEL